MRSHHRFRLIQNFSLGFLFSIGSFVQLTAQAQDAPKPPAASGEQSASNPPVPVIKTESRVVLVDAVVTDKKGNYIHDLTRQDFKVYEDNKEQAITSFSFGADAAIQASAGQNRYLILFFDNSSMAMPDQIQARSAASKFIEQNAADDRMMAIAEFGGSLQIKQNFTAKADLLKAAISGAQTPHLETNGPSTTSLVASNTPIVGALGSSSLSSAEADLGARSLFLSIRSLAKSLRSVPGRKIMILFSAGFPLDAERMSELTATIDACNKANLAVYTLDVRGLTTNTPIGSIAAPSGTSLASTRGATSQSQSQENRPKLLLASYSLASADPQKPGGGGAPGGGGGGKPGGGGGAPPGAPAGGTGGGKGTGGGTGTGTGSGGGKGTGTGTGTGSGSTNNSYNNYNNFYNNPATRPRTIVPQFPPSADINQQLLRALADGTGGFAIYNTNDLLGGLNRIGKEQNEYYILGYVPPSSNEGACHTLKVKLNHGGAEVRSRSGYCNARPADPLEGKPLEKQMEIQASGTQAGTIQGAMQVPYFYSEANVARVNLAMDVPSDALNFNKDKGKYHSNVNVLGIAYKPDGTVGARFSDTLDLNLEKDEWKEFNKQPYHYENQFDAAPGSYRLTVVFSAGGEHFGKFETPIQIAPYDGKKLTLGGIVLSTQIQRLDQISTQVDATLVEDRTPLIVKGMQITPAAKYQFKKTDNIVLYSELYAPLLKTENPPRVASGYRIFDKTTNKEVFFTGAVPLDEFIQKGNAVIPFALKLNVSELPPGNYRVVLLAVDGANNQAPQKDAEFAISN
jgi:VWFA-related protein